MNDNSKTVVVHILMTVYSDGSVDTDRYDTLPELKRDVGKILNEGHVVNVAPGYSYVYDPVLDCHKRIIE